MKFDFIQANQGAFETERMCRLMGVTSRGFRAYKTRPASQRQRMDMVVLANIREQSRLSLGSYARPRMTEELKETGLLVGHRRVGRIMRENGIQVRRNKKFKATTDSGHSFNIAPNVLNRNFYAEKPTKNGQVIYPMFGHAKVGSI